MLATLVLGVKVLATISAWDAAPVDGKLLVVDDKFLSVSGYDAATGKRAWTSKLQKTANGRHTLHVTGSGVLAWFGRHVISLDPATGVERWRGERTYNGAAWKDGGCWLDTVEGACAMRCQCSLQLFDCATNKDLGPRYEKTYVEFHESDEHGGRGGSSGGCYGGGGSLHGRAGAIALLTIEDQRARTKTSFSGPEAAVGVALATGAEAWRRALPSDASFAGHSPDGKTCWWFGFTDGITALDCASGKKLWTTAALRAMGRHHVAHVAGGGVFELRGPKGARVVTSLLDERTGTLRWGATLPVGAIGWPRGVHLDTNFSSDPVTSVEILDPKSGAVVASVPVAAGTQLVLDGRGGFLLASATELVAYDVNGKQTGRAALADAGVILGDALLVARLAKEIVILERGTLRERGRLAGAFSTVHVEGALGANRIAASAYDGKTIGKVTLARVD